MAGSTSIPPSHKLEHDPVFFYSFVELQVENVLFRLPECYLHCSAFFRERLNAEQVPNEPPHLLLENVTVAEFRSLLNVMTRSASDRYALLRPLRVPSPGVDSDYPSVLKLATLWGFENIRRHMIRKLRSLEDPVLKLSLARKYNVTEFLPDAITELVERPGPLVLGDYEMLGIELAVQVTQYRELCHRAEKHPGAQPEDVHRGFMEKIFGAKFVADVKEGEGLKSHSPPSSP